MKRSAWPALALGVVLCLAACGGGGGGGAGPIGGVPELPRGSLVPAAPALGEILADDASMLRPLQDGAVWRYDGTLVDPGGGANGHYSATVTQRALDSGAIEETQDNVLDSGTDTIQLTSVGGVVTARYVDVLGTGGSEVTQAIELSSPVRVGDQVVVIERSDVPLGGDVDGDGKADSADTAIYSRVIGAENVELPALSRTVQAVRVDTVLVLRVLRSSDGAAEAPAKLTVSTWYTSGVGVVRRQASGAPDLGVLESDERLTQWSSVSAGLGAQPSRGIQVPDDLSNGSLLYLPPTVAGVAVGSGSLLVASSYRGELKPEVSLAVLDAQGVLQKIGLMPGIAPGSAAYSAFAIDERHALVVTNPGQVDGVDTVLTLNQVDVATASARSPTTATIKGTVWGTAWDGTVLWVLSERSATVFTDELVLQAFDSTGAAVGAERVLATEDSIQAPRLAAGGGRVLATWNNRLDYRYAVLPQGVDGPTVQRKLATHVNPNYGSLVAVEPLVDSGIAVLSWRGPAMNGNLPSSDAALRAVTLDPDWQVRRNGSLALDEERLPSAWIGGRRDDERLAVSGDALFIAAVSEGVQPPFATVPGDYLKTTRIVPGSSALSASKSKATTLFLEVGFLEHISTFSVIDRVLAHDGAALVVGRDSTTMSTLVRF